MKRTTLFFAVDVIAFVLFVLLTSTGILVRYTLPPGSGHFTTLLGMDRHDWGEIHFWMALVLLATLAVHLFFHWKWLVSMIKGKPREGSGIRFALAIVGLIALLGLVIAPLFVPVEQTGEPPHKLRATEKHQGSNDLFSIEGSMTLQEVELQTGVPTQVILTELGLPADTPIDEKLGRLRRTHGFEMEQVREIVMNYREQ